MPEAQGQLGGIELNTRYLSDRDGSQKATNSDFELNDLTEIGTILIKEKPAAECFSKNKAMQLLVPHY